MWISAPQQSYRIIWIPISTGMIKRIAGMTEGRQILALRMSMIFAPSAGEELGVMNLLGFGL